MTWAAASPLRGRAREVLGEDVRVAVLAYEGGKPRADAPGGFSLPGAVLAVLIGLFNATRRGRPVLRVLALTGDSAVLLSTSSIPGPRPVVRPVEEIDRIQVDELQHRDSTTSMLIVTMHGRELWIRSNESMPFRDALRHR